jgi:glycolate oxidase iron-sulfur subunit
VGLVLGCVQRLFDPAVNAAAIRVLSANGIEVVIPPDQGCCGAVTHHQGELKQTCELATDLMASFAAVIGEGRPAGPEPLDAVLVAASGCGHTLKHYGEILATGPSEAGATPAEATAPNAAAISATAPSASAVSATAPSAAPAATASRTTARRWAAARAH